MPGDAPGRKEQFKLHHHSVLDIPYSQRDSICKVILTCPMNLERNAILIKYHSKAWESTLKGSLHST
jgi:hypothetical protein